MTDLKISELTDGGGLQADDEIAVNRGGNSRKARGVGTDGWINDTSETWTFGSFAAGPPAVGTFTVTGDLRAKYTVGTRIKLTQTTVKFFVVSADPTYNAGTNTTTVTISGGTDYTLANAAITANYHSYSANPQGYPTWFTFAGSVSGFSGAPAVSVSRFSVVGRTCTLDYSVSGTSNATTMTITLPITAAQTAGYPTIASDGGTSLTTPGRFVVVAAGVTGTFAKDYAGTAFTNAGTKAGRVSGAVYEI